METTTPLSTVNIILIAVAAALFAVIVISAIVAAVYFGRRLFRPSTGIKPNENPERLETVRARMPPPANGYVPATNPAISFNNHNRSPRRVNEYPEYRVGAHMPGRATAYVLGARPPPSFVNRTPNFYGPGYRMSYRY